MVALYHAWVWSSSLPGLVVACSHLVPGLSVLMSSRNDFLCCRKALLYQTMGSCLFIYSGLFGVVFSLVTLEFTLELQFVSVSPARFRSCSGPKYSPRNWRVHITVLEFHSWARLVITCMSSANHTQAHFYQSGHAQAWNAVMILFKCTDSGGPNMLGYCMDHKVWVHPKSLQYTAVEG